MKKKLALFTYMVAPVLLLVSYTNCGRIGFNSEMGMNSASLSSQAKVECDAILMDAYAKTWFPVLSTNCNSCHGGAHGSTDLNISYSAFMAKGTNLITYQGSNPHGGNNVNISQQISGFSVAWSTAQGDYTTCLASTSVPENDTDGTTATGSDVETIGKVIPMVSATIKEPTKWKTVSWDLETDVNQKNIGKLPAVFSIEARYALNSGSPVGFEFRNPRMRLKTGSSPVIQVNALDVKVDGTWVSDMTTYTAINTLVDSIYDIDLAPGSSTALTIIPVKDQSLVAFVFRNIWSQSGSVVTSTTTTTTTTTVKVTTTTTTMPNVTTTTLPTVTTTTLPIRVVKLSDLLGSDPTLGVFSKNCVSCHNGTTTFGGLNLTNQTQAISKASTILSRMTNASRPMPTSGLLSADKIQVVRDWVNGGAKP